MMLLTKLFLAHLLGDFIFQPSKWVKDKEEKKVKSKYIYYHTLIHFALSLLLLWDLKYWKIAVVIAVSHYLIDLIKLYITPSFKNKSVPFFIDQAMHIAVLYGCVYYGDLVNHTVKLFQEIDLNLVTAFVFVSFPAAIIISKLLQGMARHIEDDHESLPNAGMYIGIIERFFVLTFLIAGHWEVIGFLIAAKSVFRFNDLKDSNSRELTEYILIGTLLSFGIAILTGIVYNTLLSI
ncbi:DUF3307 domain-containing protein [Cellulophaga sp. E16_2]|uniref:DUF3307 domain-containing protein n=1 Tax=Cellulophaga algicola (strain DSM 14237 / IC166 / ACAM 630) TaxID=688270 RepID=E6X6A0_CELAD|nr:MULTISPECIES: DUF3307 domain-containing protein [Cellulophaga]ADV47400.1 hypothetical protein Celal_0042 [Cellulophaga algicola DSM 14237]MBO0589796.1 DUF3307 domain-containing protein [Cellulophaga sp. E16_2]